MRITSKNLDPNSIRGTQMTQPYRGTKYTDVNGNILDDLINDFNEEPSITQPR